MTRILYATIIGCMLVMSLMTSTGFGTNFMAAAFSDRSDKPHDDQRGDHGIGKGNVGTCPSQSFLEETHIKGAKKILDISYTAQNDEDSGVGGYWGLDHFTEHLKVWQLPDNTFYALKTYDGVFITPQGAVNPADSTYTQTESSFGTIKGGYVATFAGTFTPGSNPTTGNIGTFNYGGTTSDILLKTYTSQQGDLSPYSFLTAYFTGSDASFTETHWGWTYELNQIFHSNTSVDQWCNYNAADGGNSGDIRT